MDKLTQVTHQGVKFSRIINNTRAKPRAEGKYDMNRMNLIKV